MTARSPMCRPLACAVLLASCGAPAGGDPSTALTSTSDPNSSASATSGTAATVTDSGSDTASQTTSGFGSGSSGTAGQPPSEPAVHYVGRFDDSDPARLRTSWSGSGLVVRFDGTGVNVELEDAGRYFTVRIDGEAQPDLATSAVSKSYAVAANLAPGEHVLELYRRTEGSFGPTTVLGVTIEGELLPPPAVARRIEVIGDSISVGYGNEGVPPCNFSAETENHFMTYGAIAARELGAELRTIAWSGKGVVYNYADDVIEPMPELYDRVLATEASQWQGDWQADLVVINLGTNDFSTGDDPPAELFVPAYVDFLTHLRQVYPEAYILAVAPSLSGDEAALVEGYLLDAVGQRTAAGDTAIGYADVNVTWLGSGCDGHPDVATHQAMAVRLVEQVQARLGW